MRTGGTRNTVAREDASRRMLLGIAIAAVLAVVVLGPGLALGSPDGSITYEGAAPATHEDCLFQPVSAGVAADGSIYVADRGNARIVRMDASGTIEASWSAVGTHTFTSPRDVGIDTAGNVYILDDAGARDAIVKCTPGMSLITTYGAQLGGTMLGRAQGMHVDGSGNAYVADTGNNRILKYAPGGSILATLAGGATLNGPTEVAVDATGNVWVADQYDHQIVQLNATGGVVTQWGSPGVAPGELANPVGISMDASSNLLVSDSQDRVQQFSRHGVYLGAVATKGIGYGGVEGPRGIALDASGQIYVAEYMNARVQRFTASGLSLELLGQGPGSESGRLLYPMGLAMSAAGDIYVAEYGNSRVQGFDPSGTSLGAWGDPGTGAGEYDGPYGISSSASGDMYVADTGNDRIQKLDSGGGWQGTYGSEGAGDGQFRAPQAVAVDSSGNMYVADSGNDRVQKLSPTGAHLATWSTYAAGPLDPVDVAWVPRGDGFLAVLTSAGKGVVLRPTDGIDVSSFNVPTGSSGIGADAIGNLYVASGGSSPAVTMYKMNGTPVTSLGSFGSGPGQSRGSYGDVVAAASTGDVWVSDFWNHRLQHFQIHDHATPVTGVSGVPSGWSRAFQEAVDFTPSDTIAGVTVLRISRNGATPEDTTTPYWTSQIREYVTDEGTTTFDYWSVDGRGNVEETKTATVRIDRTPPEIEISGVPTGWVNHDLVATVNVTETLSGIGGIAYGLTGIQATSAAYGGPISIWAEGYTSMSAQATDVAGNYSPTVYATAKIDRTPPTTTAYLTPAEPANPKTVNLQTEYDSNGSDSTGLYWRLDGGDTQTAANVYYDAFDVAVGGTHTVTYWSRDAAGNVETPKSLEFSVLPDSAPPTPRDPKSLWVDGDETYSNDVTATASSRVDGATQMSFSGDDSATWSPWVPYADEGQVVLQPGDGACTVTAHYRDDSGNLLTLADVVIVDRTMPHTSADLTDFFRTAPAGTTFSPDDTGSGPGNTYYILDGGSATVGMGASTSAPGTHTVEYWNVDAAGNEELPHHTHEFYLAPTPTLGLAASASSVTYPGAVTLTGALGLGAGAEAATRTVIVDYSYSGTSWLQLKTIDSATTTFQTTHAPSRKTYYRMRFLEDARYSGATSASRVVTVKPTLSRPALPTVLYRNRTFTVVSYLKPKHAAGLSNVYFRFSRYESGRWRLRKSVRGRNATAGSMTRVYASTYLPYAGSWKVEAYHGADEHLALLSSYVRRTVR